MGLGRLVKKKKKSFKTVIRHGKFSKPNCQNDTSR